MERVKSLTCVTEKSSENKLVYLRVRAVMAQAEMLQQSWELKVIPSRINSSSLLYND